MTEQYHRIELRDFDPERDGEWVDIYAARTFGQRIKVQDAAQSGIEEFKLVLFEQSIARWSYPEPPSRAEFEKLDEWLGEFIYDRTVAWYGSRRRPEEQTKSTEAGAGDRAVEAGANGAG